MSFVQSAQNIRIEDNRYLCADLQNVNGDFIAASIDLDTVIGNEWGNFCWGGQGFCGSAQEVTFSIEGDEGVPILRAYLDDGNGGQQPRDINLGERIQNDDGQFIFI